jgi:hypothetical protein
MWKPRAQPWGKKPYQSKALKERDIDADWNEVFRPFRAYEIRIAIVTQGSALGFHIAPFQGSLKIVQRLILQPSCVLTDSRRDVRMRRINRF